MKVIIIVGLSRMKFIGKLFIAIESIFFKY